MQYIKMEHLQSGMVLAKSIIGDNGIVLLGASKELTPPLLERMQSMCFQGAYIDNPVFSDIIVEDIIDTELSLDAFASLAGNKIERAISLARKMYQDLKYKDVVNVDLLDIKSDRNYVFKHSISVAVFSIVIGLGLKLRRIRWRILPLPVCCTISASCRLTKMCFIRGTVSALPTWKR